MPTLRIRLDSESPWEDIPALRGFGVAPGGTTGQYFKKKSETDFDTEWDDLPTLLSLGAAALAVLAPEYSAESTYALGVFVTRAADGKFYECTTPIDPAEAWTAGHWTERDIGYVLEALAAAISALGYADVGAASAAQGAKIDAAVTNVAVSDVSDVFACDVGSYAERHFKFTIADTDAKATTLANVPTECSVMLTIVATATTSEMTWPTGTIAWQTAAPPLTSGKTYIVVLITFNAGTNWLGFWSAA